MSVKKNKLHRKTDLIAMYRMCWLNISYRKLGLGDKMTPRAPISEQLSVKVLSPLLGSLGRLRCVLTWDTLIDSSKAKQLHMYKWCYYLSLYVYLKNFKTNA